MEVGGIAPVPLQNGSNGGEVLFHYSIGNYMVYQDRHKTKLFAAIPAPRKFRKIFYNFCYYFWGQHCWWTETNIIGNDFFVIYKFPLPSTIFLLPLPYRCSGVLCQKSSPKRWFANVNMTSYCDVTNMEYPVTITTIRHCSIIEFGRGIQSSSRRWQHQTSARHC